tara:strand:- start:59 stop:1120 length:1062 start_codon:yes stop_codon:yes gene_type:complete
VFRRIKPDDISISPFTSHKDFSFTHNSSGSQVYAWKAVSSSVWNYTSQSDYLEFTFPQPTASQGFYKTPTYFWARNRYYNSFSDRTIGPINNFGGSGKYSNLTLHNQLNILSIPSAFYGEKIKPKSVQITDNSMTHVTVTLKDDGFGNLYDNAYSASFAAYQSSSYDSSKLVATGSGGPQLLGGVVGNVFYGDGIVTITDTGSLYKDVLANSGSDGWEIDFKSYVRNVEYEYFVDVPEFKFNKSTNISTTFQRSGSIEVPESGSAYKFFPPGNSPVFTTGQDSGSNNSYGPKSFGATEKVIDAVTGSYFAPYVTQIGLYNDQNQLLALGKLASPLKNEDDLALGIVVRFDVNS